MEPDTRHTLIGAAILALAAAAVWSVLWLSQTGNSSDFRFYTIYFERQSLDGLQVGGDVTMRGVKVGRVEGYTLSRNNINRVRVQIRIARETPVSDNTLAVVTRNLVTGIARIKLDTPGTPGPELTTIAEGETHPVIPEGTSDLDQIADAASRLAVSADALMVNLNRFLDGETAGNLNATLVAFRDLAQGLETRLQALDRATAGIERAATGFSRSSEAVTRSVEAVAAQVAPLAGEIGDTVRDARASLRTLNEVARSLETEVRKAVSGFEDQGRSIARRTEDAVDAGLLDLRATTEELRARIESATRTLERLQDPRGLLFGPADKQLGPGERRRP